MSSISSRRLSRSSLIFLPFFASSPDGLPPSGSWAGGLSLVTSFFFCSVMAFLLVFSSVRASTLENRRNRLASQPECRVISRRGRGSLPQQPRVPSAAFGYTCYRTRESRANNPSHPSFYHRRSRNRTLTENAWWFGAAR